MKRAFAYIMALGILLLAPTARLDAADLVLAENGKSDYQIIVPDAPPTPEIGECLNQTARLVQTAFKANGCDVPVVTEGKRDASKPGLYLGDTAVGRANGVAVAQLKGWGYVHKAVGRDVIIAGRDHPSADQSGEKIARRPNWDRIGTAKGVADFLRQYAGTRFLYPDLAPYQAVKAAEKIDLLNSPAIEFLKTPVIAVPADLRVQKTPLIRFNTAHPAGGSFYDLANNRFPRVDDVFGGHTYERAVPVAKYGETCPEYFALVGGKRVGAEGGKAQYCISNPKVQDLIYQDLIGWLDRGYDTVDLGQPDGFRPCQCENCEKLFNTGSDWSEKLWLFHHQLAERVLAARPGKQVTMMSYILTAMPPKTFKAFPKNTRIMLTGTNEEDIAPWRGHEVPGGFTSYLYNWCPNLGTRYTPMRTPAFVEAQAKRLAANRIQAIYRHGPGILFGLEGPVYYTMGRMFDDPESLQAKELVHEFCGAAFGKAAPAMLEFYDPLYHAIELYSQDLGTRAPAWTYNDIYGRRRKHLSDPFQLLGFLYTPNLLGSLETQLAQAEKVADSDKVKMRLALVRREFDYIRHLAAVIHLYHAYQIQPDLVSRDRLLDAIDARNAEIESYYDAKGRPKSTGWAYVMFPPPGHDAKHLRLAYDEYQEPFADSPVNWDTKAMRQAPLSGAKPTPPKKSPLQKTREDLYRTGFEIPAEWKNLPHPLPTPLGPWLFRTDRLEQGLKEGWHRPAHREADAPSPKLWRVGDWMPMPVPSFWAETAAVGKYEGAGWYRTTFTVPADWKGRTLRLLFGGVDEQAWVYVNGHLVREHTEKSEGKSFGELWDAPFTADVPPEHLEFGKPNVLAVRVHNSRANGGIWRPVLGHAVMKPQQQEKKRP